MLLRKNGCAAIEFEPRGLASLAELGEHIRRLMLAVVPPGQ